VIKHFAAINSWGRAITTDFDPLSALLAESSSDEEAAGKLALVLFLVLFLASLLSSLVPVEAQEAPDAAVEVVQPPALETVGAAGKIALVLSLVCSSLHFSHL
jgi:hypothetical protein